MHGVGTKIDPHTERVFHQPEVFIAGPEQGLKVRCDLQRSVQTASMAAYRADDGYGLNMWSLSAGWRKNSALRACRRALELGWYGAMAGWRGRPSPVSGERVAPLAPAVNPTSIKDSTKRSPQGHHLGTPVAFRLGISSITLRLRQLDPPACVTGWQALVRPLPIGCRSAAQHECCRYGWLWVIVPSLMGALLITKISRSDPRCGNLTCENASALTRPPLSRRLSNCEGCGCACILARVNQRD